MATESESFSIFNKKRRITGLQFDPSE